MFDHNKQIFLLHTKGSFTEHPISIPPISIAGSPEFHPECLVSPTCEFPGSVIRPLRDALHFDGVAPKPSGVKASSYQLAYHVYSLQGLCLLGSCLPHKSPRSCGNRHYCRSHRRGQQEQCICNQTGVSHQGRLKGFYHKLHTASGTDPRGCTSSRGRNRTRARGRRRWCWPGHGRLSNPAPCCRRIELLARHRRSSLHPQEAKFLASSSRRSEQLQRQLATKTTEPQPSFFLSLSGSIEERNCVDTFIHARNW